MAGGLETFGYDFVETLGQTVTPVLVCTHAEEGRRPATIGELGRSRFRRSANTRAAGSPDSASATRCSSTAACWKVGHAWFGASPLAIGGPGTGEAQGCSRRAVQVPVVAIE